MGETRRSYLVVNVDESVAELYLLEREDALACCHLYNRVHSQDTKDRELLSAELERKLSSLSLDFVQLPMKNRTVKGQPSFKPSEQPGQVSRGFKLAIETRAKPYNPHTEFKGLYAGLVIPEENISIEDRLNVPAKMAS
jgi:hypothetical protein